MGSRTGSAANVGAERVIERDGVLFTEIGGAAGRVALRVAVEAY